MRFDTQSSEARDVRAALAKAGMDWTAGFKPLYLEDTDSLGGIREATGIRALVRSDNGRPVGYHGGSYTPVQNDAAFTGPVQPLLDSGDLRIVEASAWEGGSKVALSAYVNGSEREVTKRVVGDIVRLELSFTNSHDGTSKVGGKYGARRLVCLNGATALAASAMLSGRHVKGVHAKIREWQLEIAAQMGIFEDTVKLFQRFAGRKLGDRALKAYVREVLSPGSSVDDTIVVRGVDRIVELAHEAPGADPGSLWGGVNAVTYWATHERGRSDETRAVANLFGDGAKLIERANQVAFELVDDLPALELARESYRNHATASAEFGALLGRPARISSEPTVIDSPAE